MCTMTDQGLLDQFNEQYVESDFVHQFIHICNEKMAARIRANLIQHLFHIVRRFSCGGHTQLIEDCRTFIKSGEPNFLENLDEKDCDMCGLLSKIARNRYHPEFLLESFMERKMSGPAIEERRKDFVMWFEIQADAYRKTMSMTSRELLS